MIEFALVVALAGSLVAGLWDLKTTEIPDEIPTLMAAIGIFTWFLFMLTTGSYFPLLLSLAAGTIYLAFGWSMYKLGQWGGGDAKLMAAVGYLIPYLPGVIFFQFAFFVNIFFVGAAYIFVYALILGLNRRVPKLFLNDLRKNLKTVLGVPLLFLASFFGFMRYLGHMQPMLLLYSFLIILFLVLFYRYGRVIENHVFKKTIPASKLRVGDVILDSKTWDGLTEEQVREIKKKRKRVTIKEGVRFGPVFFLSLIITLLCGNLLFLFV